MAEIPALSSLPDDVPTTRGGEPRSDEADLRLWEHLGEDPLWELKMYASIEDWRTASELLPPNSVGPSLQFLKNAHGSATDPLINELLNASGLMTYWPLAYSAVLGQNIVEQVAIVAGDDLAQFAPALARAVIAQIMITADANGGPVISGQTRDQLVDLLLSQWGAVVRGPLSWIRRFLIDTALHTGTNILKRRRQYFSDFAAPAVGDILSYQARGEAIRLFVSNAIARSSPPVALLCHSLGGIASIDLLAEVDFSKHVSHVITVGSQVALLYELNALKAVNKGSPLPSHLPPWLNLFDRNDFLSYTAATVFPGRVRDLEIRTDQPFPRSHSAYWDVAETWNAVSAFLCERE
jgi:hypothetical protein